ncbi:MAG TPA: YbhB/YbcL family Raf kinase inhibitor-like protein [Acidimicrobiia bacterium]|nr:YbhB/YbcL family Raf kinase inhibitor-like protein [Acidimicrobiia bacterium]
MADTLKVTSTLFDDGATIPKSAAHTYAGGDNVSPDLSWTGVPDGTQSLAVTCYDPDAPTTVGFVHWILFNLPPDTTSLPAGAGAQGRSPSGSVLGFTDWGESQYGGMAPPPGDEPHHYLFTVYALDVPKLDAGATCTYAFFRFSIREHVLATGTLTGRFGL